MSEILKEEDISMGFRSPDCARIVAMPLCSVCQNIAFEKDCAVFGERPREYIECERYDCPYIELNTEAFFFSKFAELYPNIVERLKKKQS